jgi:hypothetical protein
MMNCLFVGPSGRSASSSDAESSGFEVRSMLAKPVSAAAAVTVRSKRFTIDLMEMK